MLQLNGRQLLFDHNQNLRASASFPLILVLDLATDNIITAAQKIQTQLFFVLLQAFYLSKYLYY